ncbi:MAG: hypothetical protein WB630_04005 [Candidatus Acidiferrales bacterium]
MGRRPSVTLKLVTVVNVCAGNEPDAHSQSIANITEIPDFLIVDICFSPYSLTLLV